VQAGMRQAKVLYIPEDYVPANPVANADEDLTAPEIFNNSHPRGRKKRRRSSQNDDQELPTRVVPIILCPCTKCSSEERDAPIPRSWTTVHENLGNHKMSTRWKVCAISYDHVLFSFHADGCIWLTSCLLGYRTYLKTNWRSWKDDPTPLSNRTAAAPSSQVLS
jgi:hypothetical protein